MTNSAEGQTNEASLEDTIAAAYDEAAGDVIEDPKSSDTTTVPPSDSSPDGGRSKATPQPLGRNEGKMEGVEDSEQIPPPNSYRQDAKEFWKTIPKELQSEISRRELDRERAFTRRTEELAYKTRATQDILDAFQPYQDELEKNGVAPGAVVRQLLNLQTSLQKDPASTINNLIQAYGLTPDALTKSQEAIDPKYQALEREVMSLREHLQSQTSTQEQQAHEFTKQEILSYGTQTDANGQPLRPYFEQLIPTMLPIVKAFRESNPSATNQEILNAAYDHAFHADPRTRQYAFDRYAQANSTKQIEQARTAVAQAKRAGSLPKGSPGGSLGAELPDSIEETVEKAWAQYA